MPTNSVGHGGADVYRFLRYFTFLVDEIAAIEQATRARGSAWRRSRSRER